MCFHCAARTLMKFRTGARSTSSSEQFCNEREHGTRPAALYHLLKGTPLKVSIRSSPAYLTKTLVI